jgi:hypothetical protein
LLNGVACRVESSFAARRRAWSRRARACPEERQRQKGAFSSQEL